MTEAEARTIERLRAGAGTYACGGYLAALDGLQRTEICTALIFDRLQRKMRTVETLHGEADGNWNQTFYLLYFRTLGDRQNQEAYLTLARRVSYKTVLRERLAPHAVESLLFGASGLLALYPHDTYTLDLKRTFVYLAAKYEITAMEAGAWQLANIRPANHPVLRIAQAAERDESPKRIGRFKANIIGINLVCVLQFAYGSSTGREALRDSALTLLERLPAEENRYMRLWAAAGATPRNAFESQALLQLATEYCAAERCAECPVGRRILQKIADGRA